MIWAYLSSNGGGQYWLSPKLSFTSVDYMLNCTTTIVYYVLEEFEPFPRQELPKDHSNSSPHYGLLSIKRYCKNWENNAKKYHEILKNTNQIRVYDGM